MMNNNFWSYVLTFFLCVLLLVTVFEAIYVLYLFHKDFGGNPRNGYQPTKCDIKNPTPPSHGTNVTSNKKEGYNRDRAILLYSMIKTVKMIENGKKTLEEIYQSSMDKLERMGYSIHDDELYDDKGNII